MAKDEIGKDDYLFRLAPDFSLIDKAEKDFWTKNSTFNNDYDAHWYKIYQASNNKTITTDAYRGMFCSDSELAFSLDRKDGLSVTYGISSVEETYGGRHVYIVAVDESEKFHFPLKITTVGDSDYVTGVFF